MQGGGFLDMRNVPVSVSSSLPDLVPACKVVSSKSESADGISTLSAAHSAHYDVGDDSSCVASDITSPIHFYHYHIVYLPSYSVPTLLFIGQYEGRIECICTQLCVRTLCMQKLHHRADVPTSL